MTNSFLTSLTNASTPTNIQSYGFFADASSGVRITGHDFQTLFGRMSTRVAVTSTTVYTLDNTDRHIPFDTLVSSTDPLGAFNTASAGIFTAPYDGYYQAYVNWRDNEDSFTISARYWVIVNSAARPGCDFRIFPRLPAAGVGGKSFTSAVFTAAANEQIQIFGRASTGNHDLDSSSTSLLTCDLTLVERTA